MMDTETENKLDFEAASERLNGVVRNTPLEYNADYQKNTIARSI